MSRIQTTAPGITLRFVPEGEEDLAPLRDGLVDLDAGVIEDFGAEVSAQPLYEERFVGMAAAGHALASERVTPRRIAAEHIGVSRRGRTRGVRVSPGSTPAAS